MKLLRNEIRPVGYVQLELSENEVQTIIGVFEQVEALMQNPLYHQGTRRELFLMLKELIKTE